MKTLDCKTVVPLLSSLIDGELGTRDSARASEVEAHLAECAQCATNRDELSAIAHGLRALAAPEPPPELWAQIDQQLDARRSGALAKLAPFLTWKLALPTAALAALLFVLGTVLHKRSADARTDAAILAEAQGEFQKAESHYASALHDLQVIYQREHERWPEARRTRYEAVLNRQGAELVDLHMRALRNGDPETEAQLYGAYRRQIALFEEAILRSATVDAPGDEP